MTHPKVLEMAREIAADVYADSESNDHRNYGRAVRAGVYDDDEAVQSAIAAIERVTELARNDVDSATVSLPGVGVGLLDGAALARDQFVERLARFDHLPEPEGGSDEPLP